jgi:hypothetical protein
VLVPFGLEHKEANLLRGMVHGEVSGKEADAGFGAIKKCVVDTNR